jgi:RND family efflux transporter MFP subunit
VGTIAGGSEIELRFQTEGNIRALNFKEGEKVSAGQVIAQLDQSQALIKLERARSEFFRYEKLYALGGVSKDRLEEARVQYDYAQTELDKTVLKASQDGILGDKGVEVGEFVTPQKKVGTLVSLRTVLVRIGVIEKEIDKIYPGQQVIAIVDTYPNAEFKGKVENISPLVQGQSKTLLVEARIPNEGKLLLPGMFARSKIVIFEKDGVIAVPNDALEKTPQGYQVYVVGEGNKTEVKPVEVSYVSLSHSVVSMGLNPGDQVIVQRPQELKPGSPVKIIEVEKSAVNAAPGMDESTMNQEQGSFR